MFRIRVPRGGRVLAGTIAAVGASVAPISNVPVKLSIYEEPEAELKYAIEPPSELEHRICLAREAVQDTYSDANTLLQGWVSRWIGIEEAVEKRVKSFKAPEESLTPGVLYVGVATLTGSILARSRSLPIRYLLPPTFLLTSLTYFLPHTSSNIGSYVSSLEHRYVPRAAQIQDTAIAHSQMTWEMAKERTIEGRESVGKGVLKAIDSLQGATGLRLKEAFGYTQSISRDALQSAEQKTSAVVEKVKESVAEIKPAEEKHSEETKRLV